MMTPVYKLRDSLPAEAEAEALRSAEEDLFRHAVHDIAHDLNNFLTSVYLSLHLAMRHVGDNKDVDEILSDIKESLPHARDLTRQLLTLTETGTAKRHAGVGEAPTGTNPGARRAHIA